MYYSEYDLYGHESSTKILINDNEYLEFLLRQILLIDVAKIKMLLTFHFEKYWNESISKQKSMIDLVENSLYPLVHAHNYLNEVERNIQVMDWVHTYRMLPRFTKKKSSPKRQNESAKKKAVIQHGIFNLSPEFTYKLIEGLAIYFPKQKTVLRSAILKNESSTKLKFDGRNNQLAELFYRIKNSKELNSNTTYKEFALFLAQHFSFRDAKGKFELVSEVSMESVLKSKSKHPPAGNRILKDIIN